jgi:integrase
VLAPPRQTTVNPEALRAFADLARSLGLDTQQGQPDDADQLSDSLIASVLDGASRKGVEMRHLKKIEGPYEHRKGWRNRVLLASGHRKWLDSHRTREDAEREKRVLVREAAVTQGPTVEVAIREYGDYLRVIENQGRSIETTLGRLRTFFKDVPKDSLWRITPDRAAKLKQVLDDRKGRRGTTLARETRRAILAETKTFANWAAGKERGYIKPGVFAEVKLDSRRGGKKAKRSRGKPQLREFERVKWFAKALELANQGDQAALASLLALDGGLRSSEITARVVRDIDRDGAAIVVEQGKTESSDRVRDLSPEVARLLRSHIKGRRPNEPLFPEVATLSDRKSWLLRAVIRICRLAGVPRVTPHGLRGTSATRGLLRIVLQLVSAQLGHAHPDVTRQHYISPEGLAAAERLLARASLNQPESPLEN